MTRPYWRNPVVAGLAVLALAILAASTFAIVPETQQAVILRFEQPVAPSTAGVPTGRSAAPTLA